MLLYTLHFIRTPTHLGLRVTRTTVPVSQTTMITSSVASSNTRESRETFPTSTRAHVPRSPQVTSTRGNQSTISSTATADYPYGNRRRRLAAPYSAEFTLTAPASSPHRLPISVRPHLMTTLDTLIFPRHTRTPSSSSGSEYLGASSSTRVALRSPSPQPGALSGTEFEVAQTPKI